MRHAGRSSSDATAASTHPSVAHWGGIESFREKDPKTLRAANHSTAKGGRSEWHLCLISRMNHRRRSASSGIGGQQLTGRRFGSGAEQRSFLIQHNMNRKMGEQFLEFLLLAERRKEFTILHFGQNFGRDAAGDEDAAARQGLQRQVAGLGAVQRDEEIQGFHAKRTSTLETQARDFRRGIHPGLIE